MDKIIELEAAKLKEVAYHFIEKIDRQNKMHTEISMIDGLFYKDSAQNKVMEEIGGHLNPRVSTIIFNSQTKKRIFSHNHEQESVEKQIAGLLSGQLKPGVVIPAAGSGLGRVLSPLVVFIHYPNWHWDIFVYTAKPYVFTYLQKAMISYGLIMLCSLVTIFIVIFWLSNSVSRALVALEDGAKRLSKNEFDVDFTVKGGDEFSRLGKAFLKMAEEIRLHQKQLEHFAHYDPLTGLPNRALLSDFLHRAIADLDDHLYIAVVYLDLDGFKMINDYYGHEQGDRLLVSLGNDMKRVIREGDMLARIGGDEFVAVLINLGAPFACKTTLARLLEAASTLKPWIQHEHQVSASLGVTFYPQEQSIDADQLLRQADQAMYQAKLLGKSKYYIFDTNKDRYKRSQYENLKRIELGLKQDEFILYYQPKVNLATGEVVGVEALIRWQHPEKGILHPDLFLPMIEGNQLSIRIGEWVIDTALAQIRSWKVSGIDTSVSVNISAFHLQKDDFVDRIIDILSKYPKGLSSYLEFEILETSAFRDLDQVSRIIHDCKNLGINFSLDDFGTGYSSLTYFKQLQVSTIKIDKSFVHDLLDSKVDREILQGIVKLSSVLNREVLAEGVESISQGGVLKQLGCKLAQGFGISKPMPAGHFQQWIKQWAMNPFLGNDR